MPIEVGSEITVLTAGAKLLIGVSRVIDVQFCSSATRTLVVGNVFHHILLSESLQVAEADR